jgi:integrase
LGKTEAEMYQALARLMDEPMAKGMSAVMDRYRREVIPTKAPRTQKDNLKELANLETAFGDCDPATIKPVDIYKYKDARGTTAKTRANRELALLSHVFTCAIEWGIVESNPCSVVRKFTEKPRKRYVEDWEYAAVFALASPTMQAAMEIAATTGIREADILALRWQDIREDGIPITQGKTGKKQIFEWSPRLRAAIDQLKAIERPVKSFCLFATSTGAKLTSSGFQTAWQRLMATAIERGVITERFTFHDLRAKAGSDAINPTELLGHQSPATTKRIYIRKPSKVTPIG